MDPLHNVEQAYTNLALLEDHMLPGKTCEDCCLKHFRLISGLLDEGISLDTRETYTHVLAPASVEIRRIEDRFFQGVLTPSQTAKRLRALRKQLTPLLKGRYGDAYRPPTSAGACGVGGCDATGK